MATKRGRPRSDDKPTTKKKTSTGKRKDTRFKKGNTVGKRFSSDYQPKQRKRKTINILSEITDIPRDEIANVIKTIFFSTTTEELEQLCKDDTKNGFIRICAQVAYNSIKEGKISDFDSLLQWVYTKKKEMLIEIDDISKMSREEKEAEARRLLEEEN